MYGLKGWRQCRAAAPNLQECAEQQGSGADPHDQAAWSPISIHIFRAGEPILGKTAQVHPWWMYVWISTVALAKLEATEGGVHFPGV